MATKKEQTNDEQAEQTTRTHYLFPNMGSDMPAGAQPFSVEAETGEQAQKLNEDYLNELRKQSKEETN